MEALRILSTRAQITATSFTNHYKWGDFKGDPNRLIGRSRLDPFRRGCDLAEVVELGEYLVLDCYSARKFGSDSISMTGFSDSSDEADTEHIRIGASLHLALGGLQIVDLASIRQYLASIGH